MMDEVLDTFVTPATIVVCLAAYVITYVIRTLVEGIFPQVNKNHYWLELFLPLGPIVNGALLGFMAKSVMWPDMFNKTVLSRCMYGSICGLFSAFLYGRVCSWLNAKAGGRDAKFLPPEPGKIGGPEGGPGEHFDGNR